MATLPQPFMRAPPGRWRRALCVSGCAPPGPPRGGPRGGGVGTPRPCDVAAQTQQVLEQIDRLLAAAMFRPERRDVALFTPPSALGLVLRTSGFWEKLGRALFWDLAGVTLTEAVKDTYAAMPVGAPAKRRVVLSEAA